MHQILQKNVFLLWFLSLRYLLVFKTTTISDLV